MIIDNKFLYSWQVRRNVMDVSYHIAQYTNIICELREEVKRLRVRLDAANKRPPPDRHLLHDTVNPEVDRLKEQLLDVFKEQMELRRQLVIIHRDSLDIAVDLTSSSMAIKK